MVNILVYINVLAIIIVGLIGFRSQWMTAREIKEPWRWIKQALGAICVLWSGLYIVILANIIDGETVKYLDFTRTWLIRPMLLITLTFIAASGIARRKT